MSAFCLAFDCANTACPHHHAQEATERPRTDSGYPLPVTWAMLEDTEQCRGYVPGMESL